jgi:hypothetical protein
MDPKPQQGDSRHKELDLRIQGKQVEIDATRTLVETTRCEFKMQLAKVEAQAERRTCGRTGTDIDAVQPPKFDTSTSLAVFSWPHTRSPT